MAVATQVRRGWTGRLRARMALLARARETGDPALVRKRLAQVAKARRVLGRLGRGDDHLWGGSRHYTNRAIAIVGDRAPVTSRKRTATYGNPGSDHHVSQVLADAVDFGIAEAHGLKHELSRKLGGPATLPDYGTFHTRRKGRTYRHQLIAGTHGTGPHLHYGVERVA